MVSQKKHIHILNTFHFQNIIDSTDIVYIHFFEQPVVVRTNGHEVSFQGDENVLH